MTYETIEEDPSLMDRIQCS